MPLYKLAPKRVAALTEPGLHSDGGGLYLRVRPGADGSPGPKSWTFIFQRPSPSGGRGVRTEMGLGSVNAVSLAAAREKAKEAREIVASGRDPRAVRDEALEVARAEAAPPSKPTFAEEAALLGAQLALDWRGKKTVARWKLATEVYARPFANRPADEVTTEDVLAVLQPIWRTKPETAQKVRAAWEQVFAAAKARADGRRLAWNHENPARWAGHLKLLLSKPIKLSRGHHAALEAAAMDEFMQKLVAHTGTARDALELTMLTAVRTSVTLEATWAEIDFEKAVWAVPAIRMKNYERLEKLKLAHFRIPLAPAAVALLRRRCAEEGGSPAPDQLIFPGESRKGKGPLSYNAMSAVLERMGYKDDSKATVHGFRTTFRTWASNQFVESKEGELVPRFSKDAMEFALDHAVGNAVQRAYDRADYFVERSRLMRAWATYVTTEPADNIAKAA